MLWCFWSIFWISKEMIGQNEAHRMLPAGQNLHQQLKTHQVFRFTQKSLTNISDLNLFQQNMRLKNNK